MSGAGQTPIVAFGWYLEEGSVNYFLAPEKNLTDQVVTQETIVPTMAGRREPSGGEGFNPLQKFSRLLVRCFWRGVDFFLSGPVRGASRNISIEGITFNQLGI